MIENNGYSTIKEAILKAADTRLEPVTVPEWGDVVVYVPVMTVQEASEVPDTTDDGADNTAAMVVHVARDAAGLPIFTEADIPALKAKSAAGCNRVLRRFNHLNGYTQEAVDAAKKG